MKLLVANRGEVAVRVLRAAAELGIYTVAVYSKDDASCLHTGKADEAIALEGVGPSAYLDGAAILSAARESGCDAIHPGYGFLAERADFASACADAGITFVGPAAAALGQAADKVNMRALAAEINQHVLPATAAGITADAAATFLAEHSDGILLKPVFGGGGRGIRLVTDVANLAAAFEQATAEAAAAFGSGNLYAEAWQPGRHIEVQVLGDTAGGLTHLGTIDCSLQRHFQKLVEIAPAPGLSANLEAEITDAAVKLAARAGLSSAATVEFLLADDGTFAFIEVNARLEVEHAVTEAVSGVDLVQSQLLLADGATLAELGLDNPDALRARGYAVGTRVCMESVQSDGSIHPESGTLQVYEAPSGPGIRTDGFAYRGYDTSLSFDSLLARVTGHALGPGVDGALTRADRALAEFRIEGLNTNIPFLRTLLARGELANAGFGTTFVETHMAELATDNTSASFTEPVGGAPELGDALAAASGPAEGPEGSIGLRSPIQGTIVGVEVANGDEVRVGQLVAVVEAMKLQHEIKAEASGVVVAVSMSEGDVVREDYPIVFINESEVAGGTIEAAGEEDPDLIRGDLQETLDRKQRAFDEAKPELVDAWHAKGRRTARENILDLCDEDSFKEFGPLAAGQTAGGVVMGIGSVNATTFSDEQARVAVVHYDAMTPAGTRNALGEYKQDRIYELANRYRLPLVLFSEGMGRITNYGRKSGQVNMDTKMFAEFAKLSGLVPLVGINSGECYGGNAALLGCCDVIISTKDSSIGLTRPDLTGEVGQYGPRDIGSMSTQVPNGVVDVLVDDDAAAVEAAKRYLSYFQGPVADWEPHDQRRMRHIIPEDRVRTYNVRDVIETLADKGSVMELRPDFGIGIITALFRIEGRPMGLVANNPVHLAGAIDSPGADKGTRFLELMDSFDIPVLSMMDCPGIMVGPDHEREAMVRHCARMFNVGANLTTPMFGVVIRKAYGLGVQAMCGASSLVPFFTVAWPTAEFAGMNIDGGVKLSSRRELMAIEDPEERIAAYDRKVSEAYEKARAVNSGGNAYGIDDIIDPADTRSWLIRGLKSLPAAIPRDGKKRAHVDTW